VTVTTAARSLMRPGSQGAQKVTWLRSPRSSVESRCRRRWPPRAAVGPAQSRLLGCGSGSVFDEMFAGFKETLGDLGIQKLGKPRVVGHALEVVVDPRLETVLVVQFNSPPQIPEAVLGAPGHRVQQRQPIEGEVGFGIRPPG